jgi:hypothetical protein
MEHFHSTLAGDSTDLCQSFFLCSLRFVLLIHFPFKVDRSGCDIKKRAASGRKRLARSA